MILRFLTDTISSSVTKYLLSGLALSLACSLGYYVIRSYFEKGMALKSAVTRQRKEKKLHKMTTKLVSNYVKDMRLIDKEIVACSVKKCTTREMKNDFKTISP